MAFYAFENKFLFFFLLSFCKPSVTVSNEPFLTAQVFYEETLRIRSLKTAFRGEFNFHREDDCVYFVFFPLTQKSIIINQMVLSNIGIGLSCGHSHTRLSESGRVWVCYFKRTVKSLILDPHGGGMLWWYLPGIVWGHFLH